MMKTHDVWNALLEKPSAILTDVEKNVRLANIFLIDFENGSWIYNISPSIGEGKRWSNLRASAQSVVAIGDPSIGQRLLQIADIVEQVDVQQPGSWRDYLSAADPENQIAELEKLISNELPRLWAKLDQYTLRNFQCEPQQ